MKFGTLKDRGYACKLYLNDRFDEAFKYGDDAIYLGYVVRLISNVRKVGGLVIS
jgi:hypothetical protein